MADAHTTATSPLRRMVRKTRSAGAEAHRHHVQRRWCSWKADGVVGVPSGTVTFLFTDIEGSTRLWEERPDEMRDDLAEHDALLRAAIEAHGGYVFATGGDGFAAAFDRAGDALAAAADGQAAMANHRNLRVRMGVHSGEAAEREGDYFGPAVNRAARLMAAGHGGQVLVSASTAEIVGTAELVDLGEHRLRDLSEPQRVYQLGSAVHPPLRSLDRYPGELPAFLTSFVGGERELEAIGDSLARSRIVTLVGVGGVGKTRMALQAAAHVVPRYADGAWYCELATVADRAAVADALAACFNLRLNPGAPAEASLFAFLRDKRLLLIMDNCEHVIDAAGSLAEAIAHRCAGVAVLATSREALGVEGELLRPLRSLKVPEIDAAPEDIFAAAAVRLFCDRAQAIRPDFTLDEANAKAVAEIVRQLDGVPLAIELAAARVGSLTVREIARRLDDRFRLLTGGRRTALERHQTLRGTVDWSYDLLSPEEAQVLDRLAVFAGGWTLEAAEAIVSGDGIEVRDVLDLLSHLVARSMIVADENEGSTRYRLLETIRQYAQERLEATGSGEAIRKRHAEHFVALATSAMDGLRGPDELRWLHIVEAELANFRVALDWSVGSGDADLALRLSIGVSGFTFATTVRHGTWRWLQRATDLPQARHHPLRPEALAHMTGPAFISSASTGAMADHLRAMDEAFEHAGLEPSPVALFVRALFASVTGRHHEVEALGAVAISSAIRVGDRYVASGQSALLAMMLTAAGDERRAVEYAESARSLALEVSNPTLIAVSEVALGYALETTDPDRAIAHLEEGVARATPLTNDMATSVGWRCLARLRAARGDTLGALEAYMTTIEGAIQTGAGLATTLICETLARDLTNAGHHELAAILMGALEQPLTSYQGSERLRTETIRNLRNRMSPAEYEALTTRGRAMTAEQLISFTHSEVSRLIVALRTADATV